MCEREIRGGGAPSHLRTLDLTLTLELNQFLLDTLLQLVGALIHSLPKGPPPRATRPSDLGSAISHVVRAPLDLNLLETVNLGAI